MPDSSYPIRRGCTAVAKIFPEHREPEHPSERRVLEALRRLGDDWHVFHNIRWQSLRRNRQGDGETDFALFHPTHGILVIEAKGGAVELRDGDFVRRQRGGTIERIGNPFQQAADCKRQMSNFLSVTVEGLGQGPRAGHAVAFPDVRIDGDLGPERPRPIILDRADLTGINHAVGRIADHWKPAQPLSATTLARIRELLLPSVSVKRLVRDEVDEVRETIVELTNEQYEVLGAIRGNRQALITGGPGTGKTLLAMERTRRLADQGVEVLLVCFNRLLGEAMEKEFTDVPNVTAGHFHRLIWRSLVDAGVVVPEEPSPEWWATEAIERFPDAAVELGLEVGAVIVDEAQDFQPPWWDLLRLLMRDFHDGWFYVFADEQQALYTEGWTAPFETTTFSYHLARNCRNTERIAKKVARIFGSEIRTRPDRGSKPRFHRVKNTDDACDRIRTQLACLLADGITADQVQVLSTKKDVVELLRGTEVGGIPLVGFGGDGIAVETVHRFKGLEAPVVLIAVLQVASDRDRALVYTGLSRAQAVLHVFGTSEVKDAINWNAR